MLIEIDLDIPLLNAACEVYAVRDFYISMEEQILHQKNRYKDELNNYLRNGNYSSDDPEWHDAIYNNNYFVDFILPRIYRGSFLVTLHAVYESTVIEIIEYFAKCDGNNPSFSDYEKKKSFLPKAKKYFKEYIGFELCSENTNWTRLNNMVKLRNEISHRNGRLELLEKSKVEKLKKIIKQEKNIYMVDNCIVFEKAYLNNITNIVVDELLKLIEKVRKLYDKNKNN